MQLVTWPCFSTVSSSVCWNILLKFLVLLIFTGLGWPLLTLNWPCWPWTDIADLWLTLLTLNFPCWPWTYICYNKLNLLTLLSMDWSSCSSWTDHDSFELTLLTWDLHFQFIPIFHTYVQNFDMIIRLLKLS